MYANAYEPNRYPPRRRRRARRGTLHGLLMLANILLLVLAAGHLISNLKAGAGEPEPEQLFRVDRSAPRISGVRDITVYAGDAVAYREGVTVTDSIDSFPTLEVDSSAVDLSSPGTYTVNYIASDAAGNKTEEAATVTVLEKPDWFVEEDVIDAAADELLESLMPEGLTVREQVEAIYSWAHSALCYAGHTDRTDWRQAAYLMLSQGSGDCFGYFAVTKLLFERLEIPNIDVVKVKNNVEDSEHYWSLVSVDGGETYYHFDATPRARATMEFCLITDAQLDAYSRENNGSHNRNTGLYPATPEE